MNDICFYGYINPTILYELLLIEVIINPSSTEKYIFIIVYVPLMDGFLLLADTSY